MNWLEKVNEQVKLNRLEAEVDDCEELLRGYLRALHVPVKSMAGHTIEVSHHLCDGEVLILYTDGGWTCFEASKYYDQVELSDSALTIEDAVRFSVLEKDSQDDLLRATKALKDSIIQKDNASKFLAYAKVVGKERALELLEDADAETI